MLSRITIESEQDQYSSLSNPSAHQKCHLNSKFFIHMITKMPIQNYHMHGKRKLEYGELERIFTFSHNLQNQGDERFSMTVHTRMPLMCRSLMLNTYA